MIALATLFFRSLCALALITVLITTLTTSTPAKPSPRMLQVEKGIE